ncbi:Ig-like domain-containing protein [Vibrio sp. ER1A]|uniref:Ig-like domain-containing protein n=2 Tax=Vibrio TaxID=662 RepID=UPI0004DD71F7|nr:Ig-like domain-containing protein [Vibrio sp. ER1A]KFA99352.1 hypothetical protein HW45_04235 [Vibrio sp. ER1A]
MVDVNKLKDIELSGKGKVGSQVELISLTDPSGCAVPVAEITPVEVGESGNWSLFLPQLSLKGNYKWAVQCTDIAGNTEMLTDTILILEILNARGQRVLLASQYDKLVDYLMAFKYLSMDDYVHGFDLFRARYDDNNSMKRAGLILNTNLLPIPNTNLLQKETDVSNKAILISHEQGFGDVINFIRFAPILKQKGAKAIYIHVLNPLWRLMQYNYGDICEVPKIGEKIGIDYHLPVMDLPYILETQANSVPYQSGYLTVAPQDSRASFQQFFLDNEKRQIAIVWRGNPDHRQDAIRSMELEVFLAHLPVEAKEANLYSLQFQPTEQEKAVLSKYGIINLGNSFEDFYDTACAMKNLDALISVDTSVVHIGGAMNIRTFVLLSDVCDWRWSPTKLTQENNWYESVSCCRQSTTGDWESAFKQITL